MRARIVAITAVTIAAGGGSAAQAATKPDLAVKRVSASPPALAVGAGLTVSDTVANIGRGRARAFRVGYWLSKDRLRNAGDVALGSRRQKPLRGRRRGRGRRTLAIPALVAPGAYYVLVCADHARRVREYSERNNCRASAGRITVSAIAVPVPLPGGNLPPFPAAPPAPLEGERQGVGSG